MSITYDDDDIHIDLGPPKWFDDFVEATVKSNDVKSATDTLVARLRQSRYSLAEASSYVVEFAKKVSEQRPDTEQKACQEAALICLDSYYSQQKESSSRASTGQRKRGMPEVYSLATLRQLDIPGAKAVVEGLIREGETGLIVGRPKIGKSRLAMQLALCVTREKEFLRHKVR